MSPKIKKQADALLNQFKIEKPPIPIERVAKELEATVVYRPFDGKEKISGVLVREAKRTVIGVNAATEETRQRFTIAHELGHLIMHKGEIFVDMMARLNIHGSAEINMRASSPSITLDKKELEANQFAAELLMPSQFIESQITEVLDENPDIEVEDLIKKLSRQFEVSQNAMEYRLKQLGFLVGLDT